MAKFGEYKDMATNVAPAFGADIKWPAELPAGWFKIEAVHQADNPECPLAWGADSACTCDELPMTGV